jgi:excisionase family DNA binding protein
MSSNIRVTKICQYCGNDFEARKTTTRTCSDPCAKMLYKQKQRQAKLDTAIAQTQRIKTKPLEDVKAKEFLTVRDVAKLLNCSKQMVYDLINTGGLKAINLKVKKTTVRRSELDKLFTCI